MIRQFERLNIIIKIGMNIEYLNLNNNISLDTYQIYIHLCSDSALRL